MPTTPSDMPAPATADGALGRLRGALLEGLHLKAIDRAGWLRVGVERPESVAAHTWGLCWLVCALCPPELDRGVALAIATVHDLAEARVGDLTPHDGVDKAEKRRREQAAIEAMLAPLPTGAELLERWWDYELGRTAEGRWVKALDKLDMALQAAIYADGGRSTGEFVDSALRALADDTLRALARGGR